MRIDDYRGVDSPAGVTAGPGSQLVDSQSEASTAHIQSYIFRLSPSILVNDAVTFKGEISSGYARGGFLGQNSTQTQGPNSGYAPAGLYALTTSAGNDGLILNQAYMEIYSDVGVYKVGRFPLNWGLGAVWDSGDEVWDRFFSLYDGVQLDLNFGKFVVRPLWAKLSSNDEIGENELTRATEVKELGISAEYKNIDDGLSLGVFYAKRNSSSDNQLLKATNSNTGVTPVAVGSSNARLIDVYAKKTWGKFQFEFEAPFFSGEFQNPYGSGSGDLTDFQSYAYLAEISYDLGTKWKVGVDTGFVSGDDGQNSEYGALYLHPNYNIGLIMFRYNWNAVSSVGQDSIFDASITNSVYAKVYGEYESEAWTWNLGFIWAKANETAQGGGELAYQHEKGVQYTSQFAQEDDLGFEIDAAVTYKWNPNLKVTGELGMHFLGGYYEYNNSASSLETTNPLLAGLRVAVEF